MVTTTGFWFLGTEIVKGHSIRGIFVVVEGTQKLIQRERDALESILHIFFTCSDPLSKCYEKWWFNHQLFSPSNYENPHACHIFA